MSGPTWNDLVLEHLEQIEKCVRKHLTQHPGAERLLREEGVTEDWTQAAIYRFLNMGPKMRSVHVGVFRGVMVQVVKYMFFEALRRKRSLKHGWGRKRERLSSQSIEDTAHVSESEVLVVEEEAGQLEIALLLLDEADQDVISRKRELNQTFATMAAELNTEEETARGRYRRALGRLKAILKQVETGSIGDRLRELGLDPGNDLEQ